MKLYYSPRTCSLSPHIVAREAGLKIDLVRVDLSHKKTEDGRDFLTINPKGYVPTLEFDDGAILTEGPAIVQYLGDLRPQAALVPPSGARDRYRLQETLGFVNSELHKSYGPLFNAATPPEQRAERETYLRKRYAYIESELEDSDYILGDRFTAADAYLFTVTNWAPMVKLDLSAFPALLAYQKRVASRPQVHAALQVEGLAN